MRGKIWQTFNIWHLSKFPSLVVIMVIIIHFLSAKQCLGLLAVDTLLDPYPKASSYEKILILDIQKNISSIDVYSISSVKNGTKNLHKIFLKNLKTENLSLEESKFPSLTFFNAMSNVKSSQLSKQRLHGLKIKAHQASHISTIQNERPLLRIWGDNWEYLWIICWGIIGISLACLTQSSFTHFLFVGIASSSLILFSYVLFLIGGWWITIAPVLLILILNTIGIAALYKYNRAIHLTIKIRHDLIERTFETIHNGPLQTLAKALKLIRERNLPHDELLQELEEDLQQLNHELRGIYDFLQREPRLRDNSLYLGNGLVVNLEDQIHEVLYQVYNYTLERKLPYFKTLKVKLRSFESIQDCHLSLSQKRGLCRFLEEALCNVGKHAIGATRLEVYFTKNEGYYTLKIIDNGLGVTSCKEGRGTQQFRNIARHIHGKFRRLPISPRGTLCELSWSRYRHKFHLCS
ncbi:hypothetical protein [Calothrix rhizosoleniae]|uniref:hypothetical protein n=1 Tax=Calothrix rhizosoleniae TaxID=888997 RepID=UPI000B4A3A3E|nr:hypothetical protein [Calothrix rhizosoleniae]